MNREIYLCMFSLNVVGWDIKKPAAATAVSPPLMVQLQTNVHWWLFPHSHVSHIITVIPCIQIAFLLSTWYILYTSGPWPGLSLTSVGDLCLTFFIVTQIGSILEKGPSKVPRPSDQSLGQSLLCSCIIWQSGQFGKGAGPRPNLHIGGTVGNNTVCCAPGLFTYLSF